MRLMARLFLPLLLIASPSILYSAGEDRSILDASQASDAATSWTLVSVGGGGNRMLITSLCQHRDLPFCQPLIEDDTVRILRTDEFCVYGVGLDLPVKDFLTVIGVDHKTFLDWALSKKTAPCDVGNDQQREGGQILIMFPAEQRKLCIAMPKEMYWGENGYSVPADDMEFMKKIDSFCAENYGALREVSLRRAPCEFGPPFSEIVHPEDIAKRKRAKTMHPWAVID